MTNSQMFLESQRLRCLLREYEKLKKSGKQIESNSLLPQIRSVCNTLGMNWTVTVGIANGYLFHTHETSIQTVTETIETDKNVAETIETAQETVKNTPETVQTAQETAKNAISDGLCRCGCGMSLEGKKRGSLFYSPKCKNEYHNKKRN